MGAPRDWIVFSSSSGETLGELWSRLPSLVQNNCQGIFTDRSCGSRDLAPTLVSKDRSFAFSKYNFEEEFLKAAKNFKPDTLVLLVGFFGILSPNFIRKCPFALVNTHPSLLPSFSGLDKRVHQKAFEDVSVSGFTVHMVSEQVDGGTILFQHPVWVDSTLDWEGMRRSVRKREQALLPVIWERILYSDLKKKDISEKSSQLRLRLGLNVSFFEDSKGIF